ncbi:MAG: acyl-CoA thioesterase [Ferrimicrobium sp.]
MSERESVPTYIGVVYPDQVDHMGHMNVRHYVGMFDQATWVFFARMGITGSYMRETGVGMAAVAEHIEYKRELFPGDTVAVHTELIKVTNSSCQFKHTMTREEDGEVVATAELTGVHMGRSAHKSLAFPREVRSAFEAIRPNA